MRKLVVRPEAANKPSSISPEPASPLVLVPSLPPEFEPPDPSAFPPDSSFPPDAPATFSDPTETHVPPLYRNASRRALQAHRFRLVACQYEAILLVALNRNGLETGHTVIAQGGVSPAQISLPALIAKAEAMEAAGIILMQNRPGRVDNDTPVDPHITLDIAVFCALAGIPLIEHMYIYRDGWPLFVCERGLLNDIPKVLATLREGKDGIAKKELARNTCSPDSYERRSGAKASSAAPPPVVEITTVRRR